MRDSITAAIDDGRLDGNLLAKAVRTLLAEGLAMPARLAKSLADAARVSPLHAHVVATALQRVVIGQSPPPLGFHGLLELLKEILIETGSGVDDAEVRAALGALPSSGKTGRLGRDILALEPTTARSSRAAALAHALSSRIKRGERWAASFRPDSPESASTPP